MIDFYPDKDARKKFHKFLDSPDVDISNRANRQLSAPRLGTDARIYYGSSGSPEFDSDGMVIGVVADKTLPSSDLHSLAIPSEAAIRPLDPANRTRKFEYRAETNFFFHPIDYLNSQIVLVGQPVKSIPF